MTKTPRLRSYAADVRAADAELSAVGHFFEGGES